MSLAGKWIEVVLIMLSEISQTQKDKYHVFSRMWNLDLSIYKQTNHEPKCKTIWWGEVQGEGGGDNGL
jgi:hypothetical protein